MWSKTDGKNIQKTISRLNKLELSETAENIFLLLVFLFICTWKFGWARIFRHKNKLLIKNKKMI